MEFNEDITSAALLLVREAGNQLVVLPTEIPGFPGLFLASAGDQNISAIYGVVSEGQSYKIGNKKMSRECTSKNPARRIVTP